MMRSYHAKPEMLAIAVLGALSFFVCAAAADDVLIGFNYPQTGPYSSEGLDERRGAELAVTEINGQGGILGAPIKLLFRDTQSKSDIAKANAAELYDAGAKMVFGGVSSAVAVATGQVAHEKNKLFFGTITYSLDTTGKDGYRTTFRECYDSWMAAQALGDYLREHFNDKRFFYITADYTWGWTTEAALRVSTDTVDANIHGGVKTPFPNAENSDFGKALLDAKRTNPDVLVLVLFGDDFVKAMKMALKNRIMDDGIKIVVPNLSLNMAEGAGADAMEGVIGTVSWDWTIPRKYNFKGGMEFVEKFRQMYGRYPSAPAAAAYTILKEYRSAVERASTFETDYVITALEGHRYSYLKDVQYWRAFDHQSVQSVFLVEGKSQSEVDKDPLRLDYFEIVDKFDGDSIAIPEDLWRWERLMNGKSGALN